MPFDLDSLRTTSVLAYVLVFLGGVITSIGPCNVAMIPLLIGFVVGKKDISRTEGFAISLVFTIGLAITFAALGVFAAVVGGLFGAGHIWYYVVAVICIAIGLHLLGVLQIPIPDLFARQRESVQRKGLLGALLLGLVSGLVSSQCATPVMAVILTLVMAKGAVVYGATLLFVYALGRGVPIIVAGTFAGVVKALPMFARWGERFQQASGVVVMLVGFYFLWIA